MTDRRRMPLGKYVLKGKTPVECDDLIEWATWLEDSDEERRVGLTAFGDDYQLSTVFLGADHNFTRSGPPVLWETMLFRRGDSLCQWRWSGTWNEAAEAHAAIVAVIEANLSAGKSLDELGDFEPHVGRG